MSDLPISSPYRSTPEAPVTEAERSRLSERLNDAFAAGSIDAGDYQARLDRLFAARQMGELVSVAAGLPALQTYGDPAIVATGSGRPGELAEARSGHRLTMVVLVTLVVAVVAVVALLLLLVVPV